ncbi:MAG TPA: SLC13 family permease [Saprospiraceae bacterium]|nr:SLC13 family permease [Saprospiraceae bacterium]
MSFLPFIRRHLLVLLTLTFLILSYFTHGWQAYLGLSPQEEIAAIILVATAILWISEAIPLYITSLGVLFFSILWLMPALETAGIEASKNDFLIAFFGDITLLFMGGFVLAALLNKYGISQMLAQNILKRTGSSSNRILFSIILVSAFLSMWISNTGTAAMMFAIMAPVIMELPDTNPFSKGIALAIPFACNIGGIGTPIGTPPNAIAMEYITQTGIEITFFSWMLIAIPLMLLLLFLLWKILLRIYPPAEKEVHLHIEADHDFGASQYLVVGIFLLTVIGWLTSGLTGISTGTVGLFVVLTAFGTRLLETQDFKNISWDILFMLGGGLCLGIALQKSGFTATIADLIPTQGSYLLLLLILLIISAVMTTFMSNTATANLLIPVAVSLPNGELILSVAIALMCSTSMALPISTPPNAIAFGSGLLKSKDMLSSGLVLTGLALIGILLACIFYLPLVL